MTERSRLGVAFGVIYPADLPEGDFPRFSQAARAGALDWLADHRFKMVIYPARPTVHLDTAMQGWLFAHYRRQFTDRGVTKPAAAALGAVFDLEVVAQRPSDLDYDIPVWPGRWPRGRDLAGFLTSAPQALAVAQQR